ncbi:MAG: HAMP domain-containing histidine kinase [Anaerolineaceae bacterium]|nr:HAMP domain-containing histidine kinase [Anaerolineaceae bacterium]
MVFAKHLNFQSVLDGLGQGVLIFNAENRLVGENLAVRSILGNDLSVIRAEGWTAAVTLFDARLDDPSQGVETMRQKALESARPVRFHIFRSGEYVSCWVAMVHDDDDQYVMLTIDINDWTAISELMGHFRDEVQGAANATKGHTDLIIQSLRHLRPGETLEQLSRRVIGFTHLIGTHMHRLERLMLLLARLEAVRTGRLKESVNRELRKVNMADFMEDFIEGLDEVTLIDPETETQDYRSRLSVTVPDHLLVEAAPGRLTSVLHDILRNAIMYSMKATPIMIMVRQSPQGQTAQIDVIDQGYGVRAKEFDRVFEFFKRARQPQIIGEFGYGLSLYLCKHEVEAMNGKIWFESEEGVGTTFSFKLPIWQEDGSASSQTEP